MTLAFLSPLLLGGGSGSAAMSLNEEGDSREGGNLLVGEMEPGWEGLRADTAGRREPEHRIYIKIFVSLG